VTLRHALAIATLTFAGLAAGDLHADVAPGSAPTATATATGSSAAPGPASPSHVSISAAPVFGTDAAVGDGWLEVVVRVDNAGSAPAKGTLEMTSSYGGYSVGSGDSFVAQAPFAVQARSEVVIRAPLRGMAYAPSVYVLAKGEDGSKLAEATVSFGSTSSPLLVDVDEPSRLSVVMRGWPMAPGWHSSSAYVPSGSSVALTVGAPQVDAATGDVLLPEQAAGYSGVTALVIPSDRLASLQGPELDALVGWVIAGGTIAVFPTRPEDLRTGTLTTLVGGTIATAAPPAAMMTAPAATRSGGIPSYGLTPPPPTPSPWGTPVTPPDPDAGATPIGFWIPARTTPFGGGTVLGPSAPLRSKLVGFSGGNLVPSVYGATAAYGLGQVHVLGFDPTSSPALEDGWTHGRLLDMVGDAWERRALIAFFQGGEKSASNLYEVHRALDPNENFRPALGIAAILLVLYSIVSGPIVFMRAHKRGRPLDPLVWAPVASATCFALIVVVGLAGKGWSGRARHLALVEAGAGMSRGSVHRFRGFFASQTRAMRVRASQPGSVLEVVTSDSHDEGSPVLRLDKDGASLENLTSLPWQTVVVSEDGFAELGSGIAVRQKSDGSVVVANHTGKRLKNVTVWAPKSEATFFAFVDDGTTVISSSGKSLFTPTSRETSTAGTRTVHQLDSSRYAGLGGESSDLVSTWSALSTAAGTAVDWWPDDVPVVTGEIVGGEGAKADAGLRVESDRLLFRVVGEGGAT